MGSHTVLFVNADRVGDEGLWCRIASEFQSHQVGEGSKPLFDASGEIADSIAGTHTLSQTAQYTYKTQDGMPAAIVVVSEDLLPHMGTAGFVEAVVKGAQSRLAVMDLEGAQALHKAAGPEVHIYPDEIPENPSKYSPVHSFSLEVAHPDHTTTVSVRGSEITSAAIADNTLWRKSYMDEDVVPGMKPVAA